MHKIVGIAAHSLVGMVDEWPGEVAGETAGDGDESSREKMVHLIGGEDLHSLSFESQDSERDSVGVCQRQRLGEEVDAGFLHLIEVVQALDQRNAVLEEQMVVGQAAVARNIQTGGIDAEEFDSLPDKPAQGFSGRIGELAAALVPVEAKKRDIARFNTSAFRPRSKSSATQREPPLP